MSVRLAMSEKVLIVDEAEAAAIWRLVTRELNEHEWDLEEEADWCEAYFMKQLQLKLTAYLDHGTGKDVREV
jgi:hypothetical protein